MLYAYAICPEFQYTVCNIGTKGMYSYSCYFSNTKSVMPNEMELSNWLVCSYW